MLPWLADQTVERLRATTTTDSHGNVKRTWPGSGLSITGCSVQPVTGSENVLARDSVMSKWTLFAPDTADILSTDRIRHDGVAYEVDGSVQKWHDPTGSGLGHLEILLKKVTG